MLKATLRHRLGNLASDVRIIHGSGVIAAEVLVAMPFLRYEFHYHPLQIQPSMVAANSDPHFSASS
jgi:hypothetical protein